MNKYTYTGKYVIVINKKMKIYTLGNGKTKYVKYNNKYQKLSDFKKIEGGQPDEREQAIKLYEEKIKEAIRLIDHHKAKMKDPTNFNRKFIEDQLKIIEKYNENINILKTHKGVNV